MSIALLIILVFFSIGSAQNLRYVRPSSSSSPSLDCPGLPCFTLHQYIIEQATEYFTDGSTFIFLSGNHTLKSAASLSSVSDITLKGESDATISLGNEISCIHVMNLVIFGLKFIIAFDGDASDMSAWKIVHSINIFIGCSIFEGNADQNKTSGRALHLSDSIVSVSNCLLEGNIGENGGATKVVYSTFLVKSSTFSGNRADTDGGAIYAKHSTVILHSSILTGNGAEENGGALILLNSVLVMNDSVHEALGDTTPFGTCPILMETYHMNFKGNTAGGDGGAIFSVNSQIQAAAGKIIFFNNTAQEFGGGLRLFTEDAIVEILIAADFIYNTAGTCGGAGDVIGNGIVFKDTLAVGNSDSAFCVSGDLQFIGTTNFSWNTGELGGAMYIHPETQVSFSSRTVFNGSPERGGTTDQVAFDSNSAESGGAIYALNAVKVVFNIFSVSIANNEAQADGGAIYSFMASFSFYEVAIIDIIHNSAQNGGAMYLTAGTSVMFGEGVQIYTIKNQAFKYGGVIYYEDATTNTQCKYKGQDAEVSEFHQLPYCPINFALSRDVDGLVHVDCFVISYNDSSGIDGSFLYGGFLDRCQIGAKHWLLNKNEAVVPFEKILNNFQFQTFGSDRMITSQPYQLCFCSIEHDPYNCTGKMNIKINRGQIFAIYLLALDQVRTSIPTKITAKVQGSGRLKSKQSYQALSSNCSELKYILYSTSENEELIFYPDGPCRDTGLARAVVNVILLPCPRGFNQPGEKCICEERLEFYGADCTIHENVLITKGPDSRLWMSALYRNNTYQGLILYHTCPVEYCTMEIAPVDLDNPDMQCANNRSGMLCGACAANYSLMLGSSRCEECSNTYLALLLPFAAAGIALVVFLSVLRLTVATGMINSVILYANIVQAKRGIFFPSNTVNVLTVFIAWMNLDLGFETCFYNGLTAYAETWLQFAFPIYVWMLISIIIFTSKYSLTISKWIGHNPIAVLATLLLMSYTKILKVIIDVYRSVNLDYPENKIVTRWLKDANLDYLHSKHLALSVVTSLVLVFVFLPYTLLLLLGYKFYRFSSKRLFHWLNRLKPLLDSYYAPYNKHTRYWTGFLLLVRCALYVTFSFGETWSLLAICVTFTLILAYKCLPGKVHSKSYNDILEIVTYTNLTILTVATAAGVSSGALVYSLVGIVFSIMMGIIFYQFYSLYIAKSGIISKIRALKSRHLRDISVEEKVPDNVSKQVSSTTIELREPLLEN